MIKIKNSIKVISILLCCCFLYTVLLFSCKNYNRNSTHANVSFSSISKGEVLAEKYCQSCHLLPSPSWLDTKTWEKGVLPQMGPRLGIMSYGLEMYPSSKSDRNLDTAFYPSKPLLTTEEWKNIIDYYVATSPDSLPPQQRKYSIEKELPLFTFEDPRVGYENPATSFVKINSTDPLHALITSDAMRRQMYFLNAQLQVTDSLLVKGPIVNLDSSLTGMLACNIGILNPNNGKAGSGQYINIQPGGKIVLDQALLLDSLQRPVQITETDFNNDHLNDYLVCEFGFLTGALSWMENTGNNKFKRHVLRPLPGAIKAYIEDYNHDGLKDIWVLFAQGEEGVFLFTNKGHGNFEQEEVLRFPPVYGSSYFELTDFNKDGYPDIVYTCGDNADYSPVLKPYHGVYIFMNDKTNHFKQQFFFPINGCYKAIARDYDGDGDLDLATISFFADYAHQPEESFVYLKNEGNFDFHPYTILAATKGRWLTMDAGDLDGDGKIDLVLGNFSIGPAMMKAATDWKKMPPFLILKNTGK